MNISNKHYTNKEPHFNYFRYKKIMTMYPFNDTKSFEKWLDANDLSKEKFLQFFNTDLKSYTLTEKSPWIDYLVNSYVSAIKVPSHFKNPLGVFIDFMVEKASFDFKKSILNIKNTHKANIKPITFKTAFTLELSKLLTGMVAPLLNLEFSIACEEKIISGEESDEEFKQYIILLSDKDYVVSVFKEYPSLLEGLIIKTSEITSKFIRLFTRMIADYSELNTVFGDLGVFFGFFENSRTNLNSVKICQFKNKTIIYSPAPLDAGSVYQKKLIDKKVYVWTTYNNSTTMD